MLPRTLLKGKNFRDKLYSDKYLSGVWSTLGSENIAHIMASSGLDYILIDLEHGLGGFDTVSKQVLSVLSLEPPAHQLAPLDQAMTDRLLHCR